MRCFRWSTKLIKFLEILLPGLSMIEILKSMASRMVKVRTLPNSSKELTA